VDQNRSIGIKGEEIVRNVGVDVESRLLRSPIRAFTTPIPLCNRRKCRSKRGAKEGAIYLHSEIVKEDAFFRFDAVSSTCGEIELRIWFSTNLRNTV
jgi:hypothetical protein